MITNIIFCSLQSNVHKQYSPEEEGVRKAYFIEAERSIQRQNRRPLGYKAAHNKFSDMVIY